MMKVLTFLGVLFFSIFTYSQELKGVVLDENNMPLPGANIVTTDSNNYAVTDFDGNFIITIVGNEQIKVSYIGYETLVTLPKFPEMTIELIPESNTLEEVIVVGYGTKKAGSITGSVVQIKSSDILKTPSQSAIQSIQGKAAGVNIVSNDQPGESPSVRIRGLGTIIGGRDPLYVIDGVEASSLNGINPNDIETFDVLKDASSLAIYGQKGANGVIAVTTKKGKNGDIKVNFDHYYGLKTYAKKVEMADSYKFAYYNVAALGGIQKFSFEQPVNTDWFDEITRIGDVLSNYLSFSGGNDISNYYLGLFDYREKGILKGNDYQKNGLSSRNEIKILNKKVKFNQNLNIISAVKDPKPLRVFTDAYRQSPIVPVQFENGRWGQPLLDDVTGIADINGDERFNTAANPVAILSNTHKQSKNINIFGSLAGEVTFTDFLKFNSSFGLTYYNDKEYNLNPSLDNWMTTNPALNEDDYVQTFGNNAVIYNSLEKIFYIDYYWNWDNYFTFDKDFGNHNVQITLGMSESKKNNGERFSGIRYNVPEQKNYWFLDFSDYLVNTNPQSVVTNNHKTPIVSLAYFLRANYDFNNKYLINFTVRKEGVSSFQEDKRWDYFPALSFGWNIRNEEFMSDVQWVNNLKLRLGYGEVGNSNTGNALNNIVFASNYNYAFGLEQEIYPGSNIPYQIDPNLTWEKMKEYDMGIDFGLFNSKLFGTLEFYDRTSNDVILPVNLPAVLSPNPVYLNTGKVQNQGVELSLKWRKEVNDIFEYNIGGNVSYNKNVLKDVSNTYFSNYVGGSLGNGHWVKQVLVGESLGSFYVYETTGFDQFGNFTYSNERVVAGSYLPKYTGGISFGMNYRNWDFSTDIYGVAGNKLYNGKKAQRSGGENIENDLLSDVWSYSNPNATNPYPFNDTPLPSNYYVEDGSYVRVNNITLGYNLKINHFNTTRIYLTAVNPFIFTKYSGYSPEIVGGDNANPMGSAGIELDAYPTNRNIMVGLNLGL